MDCLDLLLLFLGETRSDLLIVYNFSGVRSVAFLFTPGLQPTLLLLIFTL